MDSLLLYQILTFSLALGAVLLFVFFFGWRRRLLSRYGQGEPESRCRGLSYGDQGDGFDRLPVPEGLDPEDDDDDDDDGALPALKESRLALRESEAYLRTLYNNILDPAFLVDFETKRIVDSNQAACDLYGYTAEEFLRMTPEEISLEKEETAGILASRAERVRVLKRKHCKKGGEPIWVEAQLNSFRRKGKKFTILNMRDITEQVKMQEALEKNYRRLSEAQKIAKIGSWEYPIASDRCWASDEAHRIFGYQPSPEGFLPWEEIMACFADSRDVMRAYNEFLEGKLDVITITHDMVTRDGVPRSVEFIAKLTRDEDHRPSMLYGTVEDITDRRDLEKQLQSDARREAFLARCLRLMLKSNDVDRTITKMIGEVGAYLEADEVVVFTGSVDEEESTLSYFWSVEEDFSTARQDARIDNIKIKTWQNQLKDGPVVLRSLDDLACEEMCDLLQEQGIRSLLAAPIWLHHEMWGRIGVSYYEENATLSQRDAMLLETLARIISLGIERSRREAALLDERNRAEAANRAKSEFLANMSHEIRTPMTAILGFADILSGSHSEEEQDEAVYTIRKNGKFLLKVINNILDFSKIEANRIHLEKKKVNMPNFLGEIESLVSVSAREKGLEFRLDCPEPIPETIVTDPLRLKQILINLLGNAIKFTHEGHVTVGAKMVEKSGESKLEFSVSDSGIGVAAEQIHCLFEPFTQADSSVTRRFGGTGLGLTISARLAKMLGGSIQVASEEGEGSVFTFGIDPGTVGPMTLYRRVLSENEGSSVDWKTALLEGVHILLVEDGPDNQRLISLVLRKAGAEVSVAENGKEAYEKVTLSEQDSKPYDIILMDMQMPVMDGYSATQKIRKNGYTMPIFALTAHAMGHDRQKCIDAGCDDYISKPIRVKELISHIARAISVAQGSP